MGAFVEEAFPFNTAQTALDQHDAVVAVSLLIEATADSKRGIPKPTIGLARGEERNFKITPAEGPWDPSPHEGG
jgi:hypothetical protein